jgi:hypothetical protein
MEMATIATTKPLTTRSTFEISTPESDESLEKNGLWEVTDTSLGPKNVPGPYSGLSMSNVGEIVTEGERKDRGHDAHHLLEALRQRPSYSLPGVYCEYAVIEETLKQTMTSRVAQ